jgi:hypothetical protein
MYQSKLFAFITSGWLAVGVISVLLAIVYVLIKIPKEAPIVQAPDVVEQVAPIVKPSIKKQATPKPMAKETIPIEKPVKPVEPENQFERDLINFESKL